MCYYKIDTYACAFTKTNLTEIVHEHGIFYQSNAKLYIIMTW